MMLITSAPRFSGSYLLYGTRESAYVTSGSVRQTPDLLVVDFTPHIQDVAHLMVKRTPSYTIEMTEAAPLRTARYKKLANLTEASITPPNYQMILLQTSMNKPSGAAISFTDVRHNTEPELLAQNDRMFEQEMTNKGLRFIKLG